MSAEEMQDSVERFSDASSQKPLAQADEIPPLIKAQDASNELAPLVGGPGAAAELIINQVYQGNVRLYARQWDERGTDLSSIWREGPPEGARKRRQISRTLFRPGANLIEDCKDWNWPGGRFFVTVRKRPTTRRMMDRVGFASADIKALAKAYRGKMGHGGRPPKEDAWQQVWLQIVRMAVAGELTKERQVGREAFQREVFERLGWDKLDPDRPEKPPLAQDTLSKVTGPVWDAVIEPKPS